MEKITEACHHLLNDFYGASDTKSYINSRLSQKTQEKFQIGFFPDISSIELLTNTLGNDLLKDNKLIFSKQIEDSLYPRTVNFSYFENFPLVMPFKDPYGTTIAMVARSTISELERSKKKISKYKNTPFKKSHNLFGLYENKQSILDSNSVYIVEGQFDVIKASEINLNNVVALGSCHMSPYQFALITRYTDNLNILLDNDEAGIKGRQRIMAKYSKYANIKNVYVPLPSKDLDEYISSQNITNKECLKLDSYP